MSADRTEARISIGDLEYFLRQGRSHGNSSAFYIGPSRCSDGIHRHLTIISDNATGDLHNLHLTLENRRDRWVKWSRDPSRLGSDIAKWIKNNSSHLDLTSVREMDRDYYCISGWRLFFGFRLLTAVSIAAEWLIFRPLVMLGMIAVTKREHHVNNRVRLSGYLDMNRIVGILQKLSPIKRPVEKLLSTLVVKIVPRIAKLSLTHVDKMPRGDVSFLIPKRPVLPPLVIVRGETYRQIDGAKVFEKLGRLYEELDLAELIPDPNKLVGSRMSLPFSFESTGRAE